MMSVSEKGMAGMIDLAEGRRWPTHDFRRRFQANLAVSPGILWPSVVFLLLSLSGFLWRQPPVSCSLVRVPRLSLPVTIVIPVFNRERYLHRAISSALNQSLRNIDVLVIDDHSTDSSPDIIRDLMKTDRRLRMIRLGRNSGTHVARSTGVQKAHGTFILSLDPDDFLLPFIAEDAVHCALLHDADIVEFQVLEVLNGSVHLFSFLNPPMIASDGRTLAELFGNRHLNWNLWKRLIRRDIYLEALNTLPKRAKLQRVIYAEDKLHLGLVLLFAHRFYFLKEVGYVYFRDNPDNSESGKQQSQREALRQLRWVEHGLHYLYKQFSNLTYVRFKGVPEGLGSILKKSRRRKRVRRGS
jgi:glycosyltransferase involved in cell wall biosynthesis